METFSSTDIFLFEQFRLDRHGLFRRDIGAALAPIGIGERALDVLRVLVKRPGDLVSKDKILAAVWPGMAVEENNLTVQISTLRRILDHGRAEGSCIQTVPRRGYRFNVAVTRVEPAAPRLSDDSGWSIAENGQSLNLGALGQIDDVPQAPTSRVRYRVVTAASSSIAGITSGPALPDKPSIAVLPFANISGDPEQEYFADGMVEEIITALSRIRWLFVIARNSSFAYKGQSVDVRRVGRELGVRYVLEGSVRRVGDRVRIAVQLIDALGGTHLWADRFDGSLEDVFELQDKVAIGVAGVIEPALQAAEAARSAGRPTNDLTAYDLYLRAYAMLLSSAKQIPEALRLMEQAIARDPHYGPALAWAAICCFRLIGDGQSEHRGADRLKGADFARRALEVAGDDPGILANTALALASFGEDIGAMMALVDRAFALNPNFARGWHISGILRLWAGQPDIAIEHSETALRLNPRARVGVTLSTIGAAHFVSRRFDQAVPKFLLAIQDDPSHPQTHRFLAACYAHMGLLGEAREVVERLRALTPVAVRAAQFRNPEHGELFLSGLRLAAGEAT